MQATNYHIPVLLQECIEAMQIDPCGNYIDVTFGGGGHSKLIASKLTTGKLLAFDRDKDALENGLNFEGFTLVNQNYSQIKNWSAFYGLTPVDAILGDLGVSSHQFDVAIRGFSFRFDAPLDMRMNTNAKKTAADILNEYDTSELKRIFFEFGEIRNTNRLVDIINQYRVNNKIENTTQFINLIKPLTFKPKEAQYFAQVFQALRIEVNDELNSLKEMLQGALEILKPGGRLVIMSYHSLEDRLVKNFLRTGNFSGEINKDFFGNITSPFKIITRKPLEPEEKEIRINSRARSAKLRIAEKIGNESK